MHSKFKLLLQLNLLLLIFAVFAGNAVCQVGLTGNNVSFKLITIGNEHSAIALTKPSVSTENASSISSNSAKATFNFDFEHKAFEEINLQRAMIHLQPLIWSDDAAKIARIHSENMANLKFFSHQGIDGSMVNNRADACSISKWRAIGENIAYNRGFPNPIEFAVESWMKSPGHRENILNNRWQESGIGIAIAPDGTYFFTQVFLDRK